MKVIDDGIIKYDRSNFSQCPTLANIEFAQLEYWRKKLYERNLIGEYPENKIGFGNASMIYDYSEFFKTTRTQFIITGAQTGKYPDLNGAHYTRILDFSISDLKVKMQGPIEASSEVLTHAAIYEQNPLIHAVFHIHSPAMWKMMIEKNFPHTSENIPYGTVEMARASQKCVLGTNAGIFCMRGHLDGIVAYGRSLEETWDNIATIFIS